jgi:hypothetical protein
MKGAFGLLPPPLGLPAYEWLRFLSAAAMGDYDGAEERLAGIPLAPTEPFRTASGRMASTVAHLLLWEAPLAAGMPWQIHRKAPFLFGLPATRDLLLRQVAQQALVLVQRETDLLALRGCLDLEAGKTGDALRWFGRVFARCGYEPRMKGAVSGPVLGMRALPVSMRYAALLEKNKAEGEKSLPRSGRGRKQASP